MLSSRIQAADRAFTGVKISTSPRAMPSAGWCRAFPISPSAIRTRCRCKASSMPSARAPCRTTRTGSPTRRARRRRRLSSPQRLSDELGPPFEPEDIALTTGAFAAIMLAFHLVLDAGDEVIFSEPAWFCYEPMLRAADAVPCKVALESPVASISISRPLKPRSRRARAWSSSIRRITRPGASMSEATLKQLADLLDRASGRIGRRIFLLSDEPYRRAALRWPAPSSARPRSIRGR